jgi:hypothetical protein
VVDFERHRLRSAGRSDLAGDVRWVSECDVAAANGETYRVRRVFHFRNDVKMFDIAPPLDVALRLTPTTFMAALR